MQNQLGSGHAQLSNSLESDILQKKKNNITPVFVAPAEERGVNQKGDKPPAEKDKRSFTNIKTPDLEKLTVVDGCTKGTLRKKGHPGTFYIYIFIYIKNSKLTAVWLRGDIKISLQLTKMKICHNILMFMQINQGAIISRWR